MHTSLCDGVDSPEDMVKAALDLNLHGMGFSGHFDPPVGVSLDKKAYLSEISRLKKKYKDRIEIFLGAEVDCLYEEEIPEDLDYYIGSTHTLRMEDGTEFTVDHTPEILKENCGKYFGGDYYSLADKYYETESSIIKKFKPLFIGHFDLVTRFNDDLHYIDEDDPRYLKPALEAMETLSKAGFPFEINCGAVNRGRKKEFYPNNRLLRALYEMKGRVIISSDAHEKGKITSCFKEAAEALKNAGFKSTHVLYKNDRGETGLKEIGL